jgi:hypothetical protein
LSLNDSQQGRGRQLMQKYNDLPMNLADGTLVVLAESQKIRKIFTLRDYRLKFWMFNLICGIFSCRFGGRLIKG